LLAFWEIVIASISEIVIIASILEKKEELLAFWEIVIASISEIIIARILENYNC
jgi:hypothetical protein